MLVQTFVIEVFIIKFAFSFRGCCIWSLERESGMCLLTDREMLKTSFISKGMLVIMEDKILIFFYFIYFFFNLVEKRTP